jgi:hypothetical protein
LSYPSLYVCVFALLILLSSFYGAGTFLVSTHAGIDNNSSADPKNGSFVETVRFIRYTDQNRALEEIKQGKIEIYYFAIPLEVVSEMMGNPSVQIYDRTAGSF